MALLNIHIISSLLTPIFTFTFFFLTTFPTTSIGQEHNKYTECSQPYTCGEISGIFYPFWGENRPSYCGSNKQFELKCEANQNTSIQVGSQSFHVLRIDQLSYTMKMVRKGLVYDHCSSGLTNTSLSSSSLIHFMPNVRNITIFYDCPENGTNSFPCQEDRNKHALYVNSTTREVQNCKGVSIEVHVTEEVELDGGGIEGLNKGLNAGFDVMYDYDIQACLRCVLSNGTCGTNDESQFSCYCPDGTVALDCSHHHSNQWNWKRKLGVGVAAAVATAVTIGIAFYIYYWQKKKKNLHAETLRGDINTVDFTSSPIVN
ncbi:Wall-associated receptor kinase, galacturonan-binding domain [Sesbania bispinosa]|nr:Wall-associated receptor kinase, galacturonan-binding domain [Sesbania bispinosa]